MQDSSFFSSASRVIMGRGPSNLLLGPGPSNVPSTVLLVMTDPVVSHLDDAFIGMMEDIQDMLRKVFQTKNEIIFPVSGTGSAGMEFCFVNLIEPGDPVVIGVNGLFGQRMCDVAERCGAVVRRVDAPWGEIIPPEAMEAAVKETKPKIVAIVHAETSTGVLTPIEDISRIAHEAGSLVMVDAVTSLGGCPVKVDEWQIDAVYSATQKCLSCPPGLAPVSLSPAAMKVATQRKTKAQSWYLDVNLLANYWGQERAYHHTAPISMNYALYEALRVVLNEGLEARWKRHQENHERLKAGLAKLDLRLASQPGHQLWQLNAVSVPNGVSEPEVRQKLLLKHGIEIGGGLGPQKGKIWRVGLMGESSQAEYVDQFIASMTKLLKH